MHTAAGAWMRASTRSLADEEPKESLCLEPKSYRRVPSAEEEDFPPQREFVAAG